MTKDYEKQENIPEDTKPKKIRKLLKEETDEDENKVIEVTPGLSRKAIILVILAAVIVIGCAVIIIKKVMNNRVYESYDVVSSVTTSGDNIADYVMFGDSVLKVTKDGASYIDQSGNAVWDCSYSMKMPTAVVSGDYAVVADLNGRDVYVFNKSGKISNQTLNYDISNVDVAGQGVYTLVLTGEDSNFINAYDKDSNSVYEMKTSIVNSGYPLDIAISEDGEKLFTSYIKIDGTVVPNYLAAYNFGSVGQNENADRLMGGFTFEDTVFPLVEFVDNDTIVCFGDNQILIYAMTEKPSQKAVINLGDKEMMGVFYNSQYIGYICKNSDDSDSKYMIYIYGLDGKLEATAAYNNSFEKIYATEDELIIVGDFDCSIFYFNGVKKFSTTFQKNLINIVPDGNKQEYIVIFENETQIIKLKREDTKE